MTAKHLLIYVCIAIIACRLVRVAQRALIVSGLTARANCEWTASGMSSATKQMIDNASEAVRACALVA
jgi:hypothetical protein